MKLETKRKKNEIEELKIKNWQVTINFVFSNGCSLCNNIQISYWVG
jgi:hypothetical protein